MITEEKQLRVALYLRVSTDEQAEKYGIPAQKEAIEALIKSKGKFDDGRQKMILAGDEFVYIDDGVSGTTEMAERPALARLIEDLTHSPEGSPPFDLVAVYRIDRFARKLRILMDVLKLFEKYKVEFISANESIDTSTPFGRAMLGILGVIAELELETIKERTQKGKEQARIAGRYMGPNAPFGYRKDELGRLELLEEEARVVQDIFNYFVINKYTPQRIANILKEQEILTPDISAIHNKKRKGNSRRINPPTFWRSEKVKEILSNDIYTGVYYYNKTKKDKRLPKKDWQISPYRYPSIILPDVLGLAKERLSEISDRKTLTAKKLQNSVYLLSALLKCDHCKQNDENNRTIRKSWTGGKKIRKEGGVSFYYFCDKKNKSKFSTTCSVIPIPAEELEKYVINFIKSLLENPEAVFEYQRTLNSKQLETKRLYRNKEEFNRLLNAIPKREENLSIQHEIGTIRQEDFQSRLAKLKEDKSRYEDELAKINHILAQEALTKGYEESLKAYAEKYGKALEKIMNDREQLYELIHDLIYEIIVYSRPKKDNDVIAGRKKESQFIPQRIDITLNLPQNLLKQLYVQKFGVKNVSL